MVTGPVYSAKKLETIGKGVIVPNATYKAVYMPKTGAAGVYYVDNSLKNPAPKVQLISICALEDLININVFPQLTEEQKRNIYNLPLKASAVKANQPIVYSHWDAESQCAEEVPKQQLEALQHDFKRAGGSLSSASSTTASDTSATTDTQQSHDPQGVLIKQLLEAVLQFILQLVK